MSNEMQWLIALGGASGDEARRLHNRSLAAFARAAKAPAGERTDIVRHERAQSDLEALAIAARNHDAPRLLLSKPLALTVSALIESQGLIPARHQETVATWLQSGYTVVAAPCALALGATPATAKGEPIPAKRRWPDGAGMRPVEAVTARFRGQVERAARREADGRVEPIVPSGVANSVLTETLREFAASEPGRAAVDAPIVYRDGSAARPFPLGALPLSDTWEPRERLLKFSLLSIRHVELDHIVDGAWMRNIDVSRPRPTALTDSVVYTGSCEQLTALTRQGPVSLVIFQTGLEPAVVGLYRAVADHLRERPGSVEVLPCYYRAAGGFAEGTPWRSA